MHVGHDGLKCITILEHLLCPRSLKVKTTILHYNKVNTMQQHFIFSACVLKMLKNVPGIYNFSQERIRTGGWSKTVQLCKI